MRIMNLPELPAQPTSSEECIKVYLERLVADDALWPHVSVLLTAYMVWPNHRARRDSFVATYLARASSTQTAAKDTPAEPREKIAFEAFGGMSALARVAFDHLSGEIEQVQRRWLLVADIFQMIVDMAHDDRIVLRRGSSIAKAIDLCETERLLGHSQLRKAWSDFCDVVHLIAASAHLAHKGLANSVKEDEASILKAIWIAPDVVLTLAFGLQVFGLQPKPIRKERSILRPDNLWRIPESHVPDKPFLIFRRLDDDQLAFLNSRRAAKRAA
jgi:hypothetical protein